MIEGACVIPLYVTDEDGVKPVPLIVSVRGELDPAGTEGGDKLLIVGTGVVPGSTVKSATFDIPPPGDELITYTVKLPVMDKSAVLSVMVSWPAFRNSAVCRTLLKVTDEEARKPPPLIVKVSGPDPT